MKDYFSIPCGKAYKMLNSGTVILISTADAKGNYNLTPIAWQCPLDFNDISKFIFVSDITHKAFTNIIETKKFVIIIPHIENKQIIIDCGSCSGKNVNKIEKFKINFFKSPKFNLPVIENCIGYIECELIKIIEEDGVGIVISKSINAYADKNAFKDRLLSEKIEGKTIHHLGSKIFITTGNQII